ncbi:hypothetical protein Tco_0771707 [Tanacetum coccineum]|uniref:Uncharacterized protein n=1 Tax=Tanacetum coccineum TaxID=301880 RepID=A0ABQ4ZIE6_9ASTR
MKQRGSTTTLGKSLEPEETFDKVSYHAEEACSNRKARHLRMQFSRPFDKLSIFYAWRIGKEYPDLLQDGHRAKDSSKSRPSLDEILCYKTLP